MSDLSLYESCVRKVTTYLREGIYKSCEKNPLSAMPTRIVNDLASTMIDVYRSDGLCARDLELLLKSGRLRELKIHERDFHGNHAYQFLSQVLRFLLLGCHELEVLHLPVYINDTELLSDVSDAYDNVLRNSPNLKHLVSCHLFDLKALRNCKKLRSLKLLSRPRQPLYEFLEKENDHFLPHNNLQFFTSIHGCHVDEMVIILCHCPKLTSMGNMDTLKALSRLNKMNFPSSELKLRHCYWCDARFSDQKKRFIVPNNEIRDAVQYYPVIEELVLRVYHIDTISCLRNLKCLIYLNILSFCIDNTGEVFKNAFQEIGSRLKHLSFKINRPVDISVLLQHCPNLESLRIVDFDNSVSVSFEVHLPGLQRLCLYSGSASDLGQIFLQISGCNQLTDLYLELHHVVNDETLSCFLKKNSLSNLKVAYLECCSLTELGFRKFLLHAPKLEKVEICDLHSPIDYFERVAREMNYKAIVSESNLLADEEFFTKRFLEN